MKQKFIIPGYIIDGWTFYITNNAEEFDAMCIKYLGCTYLEWRGPLRYDKNIMSVPTIWKLDVWGDFVSHGAVSYYKNNLKSHRHKKYNEEYHTIQTLINLLDNK